MMVVDGRQADSRGVYLEELAMMMMEFNCDEAINLDGGGSSCMVADNRRLNRPVGRNNQREIMKKFRVNKKFIIIEETGFTQVPTIMEIKQHLDRCYLLIKKSVVEKIKTNTNKVTNPSALFKDNIKICKDVIDSLFKCEIQIYDKLYSERSDEVPGIEQIKQIVGRQCKKGDDGCENPDECIILKYLIVFSDIASRVLVIREKNTYKL